MVIKYYDLYKSSNSKPSFIFKLKLSKDSSLKPDIGFRILLMIYIFTFRDLKESISKSGILWSKGESAFVSKYCSRFLVCANSNSAN